MIYCGAFDSTGQPRARMIAALEDALEYGQRVQKEKADPQMGLFAMGDSTSVAINLPSMPEIDEWEESQKLTNEKEALGFYISGHPLNRYEDVIEKFADTDTVTLKESHDGRVVRFGGMVRNTKVIRTKKGEMMAFATVEDLNGAVEVIVFSSVYAKRYDLLFDDSAILIQGQVQKDENSVKILADSIIPMEKAEEIWTASVHFHLDVTRTDRDLLEALKHLLLRHSGACQGFIHIRVGEDAETVIELPVSMGIKAGSSLRQEALGLLGYNAIVTVCSAAQPRVNNGRPNNKNRGGYRKANG